MGRHRPVIAIVGAGPAGVRAAQALVEAGVRPVLIDEAQRSGGQIYRRSNAQTTRSYEALYGTEATRAEALHRCFDALRDQIDYRPHTLVWNITPGMLHLLEGTRYRRCPFDLLLICSGATDRLMPVPGWQLPGTYSLGGAQIALKAQGCVIGQRVAFMGSGPLLYLAAAQYVKAGADVAAVLDTSTAWQRLRALPQLLALPAALRKGWALLRTLKHAGVPVLRGIIPIAIEGHAQTGVSGVSVELPGAGTLSVACDAVALGYHLRPETQLADLAGCAFQFDRASGQWLPQLDRDGRSSVAGVYLAGDGARVRGADAAECAGQLAALAMLQDMKMAVSGREQENLRRAVSRYERFAAGIRRAFPWPAQLARKLPDSAVVCRCENITAGALRRVVCEMGATEANRAKAFSRVGMGRCQGRYCAHAGAEVIAAAAGVPLVAVGRLRGQAPVKPLPMALEPAELADVPAADAVGDASAFERFAQASHDTEALTS